MERRHSRARTRERQLERLRVLKRRIVSGSVVGFAALAALTARHTLGAKHPVVRAHAGPVARAGAQASFFDEHDAGAYEFQDEGAPVAGAPTGQPDPASLPPPVVTSGVS